jgi:cell division protein FtsQ
LIVKKQVNSKAKTAEISRSRRGAPAASAGGGRQPGAGYKRAVLLSGCLLAVLGVAWWYAQEAVLRAAVFQLSPDGSWLTVAGVETRDESEVAAVFEPDNGRSLASVDVSKRRQQLLAIQWVKEARVSKIWPNAVRVVVRERAPVALVPLGGDEVVRMIDADGVLLEYRSKVSAGLPVMTGIDAGMDRRARQDRVKLFMAVMDACSVQRFSERVSEINVADPENALVLAKHEGRLVSLEMGSEHLRHRVEIFLNGVDGWQSALGPLKSVNLRLEGQIPVVLDPGGDRQS